MKISFKKSILALFGSLTLLFSTLSGQDQPTLVIDFDDGVNPFSSGTISTDYSVSGSSSLYLGNRQTGTFTLPVEYRNKSIMVSMQVLDLGLWIDRTVTGAPGNGYGPRWGVGSALTAPNYVGGTIIHRSFFSSNAGYGFHPVSAGDDFSATSWFSPSHYGGSTRVVLSEDGGSNPGSGWVPGTVASEPVWTTWVFTVLSDGEATVLLNELNPVTGNNLGGSAELILLYGGNDGSNSQGALTGLYVDDVTVVILEEEPVLWGGFEADANGDVFTEDFFGWLNVHFQPWVWSYSLNGWVYAPDPGPDPMGMWAYKPIFIPPVQLEEPSLSLEGGTYDNPQAVSISAPAGTTVRYTTDGTTPTSTHGTIYTEPVQITYKTVLQSVAYEEGAIDSPVVSGTYIIAPPGPAIAIQSDYREVPNMSLSGYSIEGNTITFSSANRNRWLWHFFKISGVEKRTLTFILPYDGTTVTNEHETMYIHYPHENSLIDDRLGYEHITRREKSATRMVYTHTFKEDTAYVVYSPMHTNEMNEAFIASVADHPYVTEVETIGNSHLFDIPIRVLHITDPAVDDAGKTGIWLMGREDAYETGGSLALMGATRFILSDDPVAVELRKRYLFWIMPIFTVDGVHMGHTNYPITLSNYIYITGNWHADPGVYPEVDMMKARMDDWLNDGKNIAFWQSFHSAPYWRSYLRPQWTAQVAERSAFSSLLMEYWFGYFTQVITERTTGASYQIHQRFPNSLTGSSHSEFIVWPTYYDLDVPIYKTNEDTYQDGELFLRAIAAHAGIGGTTDAPPIITSGEVLENNVAPGQNVTYRVIYRDLQGRPPLSIQVVIDGMPHDMTATYGTDYSKGVFYTFTAPLSSDVGGFYFVATNATGTRRIPSVDEYPGPFIVD